MTGSNVKFMFNFLKTAKLFFKVVAAFSTLVQLLISIWLFGPWAAAHQASLSFTNS